jgi:hypothetical protein
MISAIRGDEVKAVDRGNHNMRIEFCVRKSQDNPEAAQVYTICHASKLHSLQTNLTILREPSNTPYYLRHAVIASVESTRKDNISEHFHEIIGGAITITFEDS